MGERPFHALLQTRKLVAHYPPDRLRFDVVVAVSQRIAETADCSPRLMGNQLFGVARQLSRGFAD